MASRRALATCQPAGDLWGRHWWIVLYGYDVSGGWGRCQSKTYAALNSTCTAPLLVHGTGKENQGLQKPEIMWVKFDEGVETIDRLLERPIGLDEWRKENVHSWLILHRENHWQEMVSASQIFEWRDLGSSWKWYGCANVWIWCLTTMRYLVVMNLPYM